MIRNGQLVYVEHKSSPGNAGRAWITRARVSKSGRTMYFDGRALTRSTGGGISGNHHCLETGDEFWISGVKLDGRDRHWGTPGPVMVDPQVVEEYLALRGLAALDPRTHPLAADIRPTDVQRFHRQANEPL